MAALTTSDQFLTLLRKSRLVGDARLDDFLQQMSLTVPEQPQPLATLLVRHGLLTDFQAQQLLAGRWRGFLLAGGKYKLLDLLGVGGMGKVYLCEHVRMKRLVALKVLPTDKLAEPSALDRFEREARAAAALDHPNIVRAHDLDTDPATTLHFLVMEFVDGVSLHDLVAKSGPMDMTRAAHCIAQAADGLQHAHEAGWVHRDVKPGNLLLDRAGTVKVLDMGLARFFNDDGLTPLTQEYDKNSVLGTADYLAPEQVADSSGVDIRADVYSLGATFYYLLTGRGPFATGKVSEKLIWHQTRTPEPIRALRPGVPRDLEAVINKMMAKKPGHRFAEPAEVAEALRPWTDQPIPPPAEDEFPQRCPAVEAYLSIGPVGPGSSASNPRLRAGPRSARHRRAPAAPPPARRTWPGLVAAFVLALAGGLVWWWTRPTDVPKAPGRVGPQAKETPVAAPAPDAELAERLPPPAPDRFVFVTRNPALASPARPDVVPSVAAALARARAGQTVLVLDGRVEEQVTLDGATAAGVRLESGRPGGRPITWRAAPGAAADQPLLRLVAAAGVAVKGFVFDGANRIDTLVHVTGASPGLVLEDLHLTDALRAPLVVADCTAPPEARVAVERVRVTTVRDYHEGPSLVPERNGTLVRPAAVCVIGGGPHLLVRFARIEGLFRAGVRVEGPADVEVRLCRFFTLAPAERPTGADAAAVSVAPPANGAVRLRLVSNTVARCSSLLRLDHLPAADSGSTFVLRSNLLFCGDALVAADGFPDTTAVKPLFAGSTGNVTRPQDAHHGLPVVDTTAVAFAALDLRPNSDHFLRYQRGGDTLALLTAGADGEPAGVPPIE